MRSFLQGLFRRWLPADENPTGVPQAKKLGKRGTTPMLKPDLTTLRVFVSVATVGNITRAAEQVHIAPSAVSKRLSDFEEDIGTKLFYRMHRGVELTPAGEAVLRYARNIFLNIEHLTGEISDFANGTRGHVRMSVTHSAVTQFLPGDLKSFTDQYPDIKIEMEEDNSVGVMESVVDGKTDIGIGLYQDNFDQLQFSDYRTDHLVLIVPTDHPLSSRQSVRFSDALSYDFVSVRSGFALDNMLVQAAQAADLQMRIRFRVTNFDAIYRMVSAKLGIGLAPKEMVPVGPEYNVRKIELDEPWATRRQCIAVRNIKHLSASAKLMVNHLLNHGSVKEHDLARHHLSESGRDQSMDPVTRALAAA